MIVRAARQLLTLHGPPEPRRGMQMRDLAIIPDGAILIRNGRIEEVGPTRRIERLKAARNATEIEATGGIVLPAFIDTATVPLQQEGERAVLEKTVTSVVSAMVRHGTGTVEVQAPAELRPLRVFKALEGRPAHLIPTILLRSAPELQFLESAVRLRLARSVTALATVSSESRGAFEAARSLKLHTAIQTIPDQAAAALALTLEFAPRAVHGLGTLAESAQRALARSATVVTAAPAFTYFQQSTAFLPARSLLDLGCALALSTYCSRPGNPDLNMLHTLAISCRYTALTPEEAIAAATHNASHAAGCASTRGTLEPGKWADLAIYDCASYQDLVQNGAVNQVVRVVRNGRTIYRRGRMELHT